MQAYVAMALVGLTAWATGCSDLKCLSDERKVGKICYPLDKPELDAAMAAALADGGELTGSRADSSALVDAGPVVAIGPVVDAGPPMISEAVGPADASTDAEASSSFHDASVADSDSDAGAVAVETADASAEVPTDDVPPPVVEPPPTMSCVKSPEICGDGVDNDCNGKVDDGTAEVCNGVDDDCNPATTDGAGTCGAYVCKNAGCLKSCAVDVDCVSGLHCVGGSCEGSQLGAGCTSDTQCETGSCSAAGRCATRVDVKGSCNSTADCKAGECAASICKLTAGGALCAADDECVSNICVKTCFGGRRAANESCDSPSDCADTLTCSSGVCKRNNDTSCGTDGECLSGSCNPAGRCANRVPFQQLCDSNPDCQDGNVCGAGICKRAYEQPCAANSDCGQGTCAPVTLLVNRRCVDPLFYDAVCEEETDCGQDLDCSTIFGRCRWTWGISCMTDNVCASGVCDWDQECD